MNKMSVITNTLFAVFCAAFINKASYAEPANLSKLKTEIKQYHDSGHYQQDLTLIITRADHYITQRAQANQHATHPQKLAIVLDIDETCLSNYNRMVSSDFGGSHAAIHHDVLAADAPAIKPMLSLYQHARDHGIAIFLVTGRTQSEERATQKNLRKAGYANWTALYVRPNNHHQSSAIPFKTQTRAAITKQGYTIVASIGDQESDLKGGYAEKTFKLPNPYYYLP